MRQLALFTLPRLESEEKEDEEVQSVAGRKGRGDGSRRTDNEDMKLEFDSNPSQVGSWEENGDAGEGGELGRLARETKVQVKEEGEPEKTGENDRV